MKGNKYYCKENIYPCRRKLRPTGPNDVGRQADRTKLYWQASWPNRIILAGKLTEPNYIGRQADLRRCEVRHWNLSPGPLPSGLWSVRPSPVDEASYTLLRHRIRIGIGSEFASDPNGIGSELASDPNWHRIRIMVQRIHIRSTKAFEIKDPDLNFLKY